jgi:hypothetical protein
VSEPRETAYTLLRRLPPDVDALAAAIRDAHHEPRGHRYSAAKAIGIVSKLLVDLKRVERADIEEAVPL